MKNKNFIIDLVLVFLGVLVGLVAGKLFVSLPQESEPQTETYTVYTTIPETEYPTRDITSAILTLSKPAETVDIPNLPTDMKQYIDYRSYNQTDTDQYYIQTHATTDYQGFRKYGPDYCVAMGTYYTERCGDRYRVTLENGNVFTVITADIKKDIHTDKTNMYTPCINYNDEYCANVLEFIIDETETPQNLLDYGSVSWYDEFDGNIVSMEYLGRV